MPIKFGVGIFQKIAGIVSKIGDLAMKETGNILKGMLRAIRLISLNALRLYGILYILPITRNLVIKFMGQIQDFGEKARFYKRSTIDDEKITYHKVVSADSSIDIRERREQLTDATKLQLSRDWGVNGVEVIASRVRIYWLPHHWNFILRCKKTDKSVVISREDFGLDICVADDFEQAK